MILKISIVSHSGTNLFFFFWEEGTSLFVLFLLISDNARLVFYCVAIFNPQLSYFEDLLF